MKIALLFTSINNLFVYGFVPIKPPTYNLPHYNMHHHNQKSKSNFPDSHEWTPI